eukprot:GHRQ01032226.1.p1 GENE.GHRQ01032226.1~~GHRQ01032226.1.p1  ORF type:complete len:109 (+),score=8.24 GHRQ01032226.1:392-718(+)
MTLHVTPKKYNYRVCTEAYNALHRDSTYIQHTPQSTCCSCGKTYPDGEALKQHIILQHKANTPPRGLGEACAVDQHCTERNASSRSSAGQADGRIQNCIDINIRRCTW